MNLVGFGEQALQPTGSRAQDAIKRLDCGLQSDWPDGLLNGQVNLVDQEALDLRLGAR